MNVDQTFTTDSLGHLIRILRVYRRMTQAELAIAADVSQSHLSRIEADERPNVSWEIVNRLTVALRVEPIWHDDNWLGDGNGNDYGATVRATDEGPADPVGGERSDRTLPV